MKPLQVPSSIRAHDVFNLQERGGLFGLNAVQPIGVSPRPLDAAGCRDQGGQRTGPGDQQ